MFRKLGYPSLLVIAILVCANQLHAQSGEGGRHSRPRIVQPVDENKRVTLTGNTHREARHENDRGRVHDGFTMEHLLLQLRRSPDQEKSVQNFIDALHNPDSPDFHKWLTAQQFGDKFGVSNQDVDTLTQWLKSYGFRINVVYPSAMVIDFSGTAEQVHRAFRTEIHDLDVKGTKHIANVTDPQVPAALAPVIAGVVSLHNFRPHPMHVMRTVPHQFTFGGLFGTSFALVPSDLATIYNLNPLFSAGNSGQGQTIALIEDTDVFRASDWTTFRSKFGLSQYTSGSFKTIHPASPTGSNNCAAPGIVAPNDAEAILDAEWASATAPSAAVEIVSCADTTSTFGGLVAIQNVINASSQPAVLSVSYGQCEAVNGAAANAAYNSVFQQAVAEGVSVFVAAGDSGAAGCDNGASEATHGIGANAFASTPYNVAVGGTDFSDTSAGTNGVYWTSTNSSTFRSAVSYIPEIPWNDSCAGSLLSNFLGFAQPYGPNSLCNDSFYGPFLQSTAAGGGSPSGCATGSPSTAGVTGGTCQGWAKPSWQSVVGNPNDGVRDTPDVSLFAADGLWSHYYVFCWSDIRHGGSSCSSNPNRWSGAGGTSFAAPIMAGIQALVNQKTQARQGNPNPVYYQLAAAEYGSNGSASCNSSLGTAADSACIFYDVTQGDSDVNCTGANNCYNPSGPGTQGVLSTSNNSFAPAFRATTGWDFATGLGTLNAANLVNNWPAPGPPPSFSLSASPSSVAILQGATGTSTITVNPLDGFGSSVNLSLSGLPFGVTASFSPSSTTSTTVLTFTAASNAQLGPANITITGTSGVLSATTSVAITVSSAGTFSLSASPSTVSILLNSAGTSAVTVTPQNGFTSTVNLSASGLPTGVTASFSPSNTSTSSILTFAATGTAATGTFPVTITGTSGALTSATSVQLTVFPGVLPSGWSDLDIGSVGPSGTANVANGVFTINGSGQAIFGTADGFNFAYQPISGDATITARVLSAQGGAISQSVGVMIRETLTPGSTNAYTLYGGSNGSIFVTDRVSTTGGSIVAGNTNTVALPNWVKLVRSGSSFTGYSSPDGLNWIQVGASQTIPMATNVFVGLAVSSNDNSVLTTATFDNVSITLPAPNFALTAAPGTVSVAQGASAATAINVAAQNGFAGLVDLSASGLPAGVTAAFSPASTPGTSTLTLTASGSATTGTSTVTISGVSGSLTNTTTLTLTVTASASAWSDLDIGSVGPAGSLAFANGVFTVNGSGQAIWGAADGFNFAYQPVSGDTTIIARVLSAQGGAQSQSVGLMIRETLTAGSTNVYTLYGGGNSAIYVTERLNTAGASSLAGNTGLVALPNWIKLVRSGNTFTGYSSPDGLNWIQVGSAQTIPMMSNVFVGLAISSNTNSGLTTATFDNVSVTTP